MVLKRKYMKLLMRVGVVICLAVWICAFAIMADAANLTVNSTADNDDGSCGPLSVGDCTLREAINAVNDGKGKSIKFDPATFPRGVLTPIMVGGVLPVIMGSGVTVDGSGTGVVIDGSLLAANEDGLVFESSAGIALSKVTVQSIVIENFPGHGIYVCGGVLSSDCNDPVSRITVSHVTAIGNADSGIRINGSYNDRANVMHSYVRGTRGIGISINAEQDLINAQVSGCTSVGNLSRGISLRSHGHILKAKLTGNTVSRNGSSGISVEADNNVIKPKVTGNTTCGNDGFWSRGIYINADNNVVLPKLLENHSADNNIHGISINSGNDFLGGQFIDNVTTGNGSDGILISANTNLKKVKLKGNRTVSNDGYGIRLHGSRNQVQNNMVADNSEDGIYLSGPGQGNKIQGNQVIGNIDWGIYIGTGSTGAQIKKNEACGNSTDLDDGNIGCDSNVWQGNTFVTIGQACIK